MAEVRQRISLFVDIEKQRFVDSDGNVPRDRLFIYRGTQILFLVDLQLNKDRGNAAFTPDANSSFFFAIDDDFDPASTVLVSSLDDQFNIPGDRGDLDVVNGKISWRSNTNTTELDAALGSNETIAPANGRFVLWMTPPGNDPVLLLSDQVELRNVAAEVSTATAVSAAVSTIIEQFTEDNIRKVRLKFSDSGIAAVWEQE